MVAGVIGVWGMLVEDLEFVLCFLLENLLKSFDIFDALRQNQNTLRLKTKKPDRSVFCEPNSNGDVYSRSKLKIDVGELGNSAGVLNALCVLKNVK